MKLLYISLPLLILCASHYLIALSLSTVTVTFNVLPFEDLNFSASPDPFVLFPDGQPSVDTSTSYSIATNSACRKITACLDCDMPKGIDLAVSLTAPQGAVSNGMLSLSSVPIELVHHIGHVNNTGLSVIYRLSANFDAVPLMQQQRTLTYTLSN
jgi:hypothetical protein